MAAESRIAAPAVVDTVDVTFPSQYKNLMPKQVYNFTFGQAYGYRNDNPACPKPEPQGPNKDAYLAYEKDVLKKQNRK